MRIGIIALGYRPGQTGGTETYFRNLLHGLQQLDHKNSYTLVVDQTYYEDACKLVKQSWKVVALRAVPSIWIRLLKKIKIISIDSVYLPAGKINALSFDVVHFPFQIVDPMGVSAKKVLTFHDMQEKHFPEFFSKVDLAHRENIFGPSVQAADRVITISDFTKKDISTYYGKDQALKCRTVHHAHVTILKTGKKLPKILKGKTYFYYPAATWPHKNHERLLRAFAQLLKHHPNVYLALTGMSRQKSQALDSVIESLGVSDRVVKLGYVDYGLLPTLYANAYCLVYPSMFEGFGLPLLEAMSVGTPVIASRTSSLPEVGGEAALYCDPKSVVSISAAMQKMLTDKVLYNNLRKIGRQHEKQFSLAAMTKATLAVYKEAYNE